MTIQNEHNVLWEEFNRVKVDVENMLVCYESKGFGQLIELREIERIVDFGHRDINWGVKRINEFQKELSEAITENKRFSTTYCSFCGKSKYEVHDIIAGPTVFICNECINISYEFIDEKNSISRAINFPPEYKQSGIAILNYFAEYVSHKYPDTEIGITIEQVGQNVRLVIKSSEHELETLEETLQEYALVVTGAKDPADTLNDPILVAKLESQLELVSLQLKQSERYTNLLERQNMMLLGLQERQVDHANWLARTIQVSVSGSHSLIAKVQELSAKFADDSMVQISLNRLEDKLEIGISENDELIVKELLKPIQDRDPSVLRELYESAKNIGTGSIGGLLATWIGHLLGL